MSVTFRPNAPQDRMPEFPCPECGATIYNRTGKECSACYGYGGDTAREDAWSAEHRSFELNLANGNAYHVLTNYLGFESESEEAQHLFGSINATRALELLSRALPCVGTMEPREEQAIRVTEEGVSAGCRVIFAGRTETQNERYIETLRAIAEEAERLGVELIWD